MTRSSFFLHITIAALIVFSSLAPQVTATILAGEEPKEKIKIKSLDELPRHSYEVSGTVVDLLKSAQAFKVFSDKVRKDIEADLAAYEIEDKTTLRRLHSSLTTFDLLDGRYDAALERILLQRELQDKPAQKLTSGLLGEPLVAALRAAGGDTKTPVFKDVFLGELSAKMETLPWDIAQDEIEQIKGILEMFGENMIFGLVQSQIEPIVEKSGEISGDVALQVVNLYHLLKYIVPIKEEIVDVLGGWIDRHRVVTKKNIWKKRSANLAKESGGTPVVVAIWDTGVDVDVFPELLFVNKNEKMDGEDTDGNGFVDDVHGIAYDLFWKRTRELLYPLEDAEPRAKELIEQIKGFFDLQSALSTPEASAVKKKLAALPPEEVSTFLEDFMRCAIYVHGTHVGGIAAEGNPFIKLLVARLTADYHVIPIPPTIELAEATATAFRETVDYFKAQGVRVVNMSWGIVLREVEGDLEANGIGETPEERAKMAREIFDIMKDGMYSAIKSAPDILFVAAAGNTDADVAFDEFCPSSFDLPNVLAAGAVDQAGLETDFTCFGERVRIYSNGFEVESYVPGGKRLPFSGTSMASPNVVNLAAKLLALEPSLTPTEVIELILEGATKSEGSKELLLIHPINTLALLKNR